MINIFKEEGIDLKTTIKIILIIMVISAVFGFIYEELYYLYDLGRLVKRGSTYGPWIPIYFFGGGLIVLCSYRFRNNPFIIFILNMFVTGILEGVTGLVLDKVFDTRLWDYNKEKLNFLNINGYVCFRSVFLFGVASLLLIYVILPIVKKMVLKMNSKLSSIIAYGLSSLFIIDTILYMIIKHML